MKSLYDRLLEYGKGDAYPFHMPGHKRQAWGMADPFLIDITEIDGFDNLHHPEGILREAQLRAARLYGAKEAFYLVNGSTAGILAGISAALHAENTAEDVSLPKVQADPEILFARNAHKSACHALYVNRACPVWLYPELYRPPVTHDPAAGFQESLPVRGRCAQDSGIALSGRIDPRQVERALEDHPHARAVFITSPTYDGVVSDVRQIAGIAHERGIPLVVDQAHGAHFGLHPKLPESASRLGADITITSLHKTLPSLTQTGLLLLGGDLVRPETVRRFLGIYQSSSPSYVLMAGIDRCVSEMSRNGESVFENVLSCTAAFRERVGKLRHIFLLPADDPTRILVSAGAQLSGREICDILRSRFHIEAEMDLPGYVLCLVGAGDTAAGFDRLSEALARIDAWLDGGGAVKGGEASLEPADSGAGREMALDRGSLGAGMRRDRKQAAPSPALQARVAGVFTKAPERACPIHEAWDAPCECVPVSESAGRVSADFAYLYPPGIPLVIPGERIGDDTAALLEEAFQAGFTLNGMEDLAGRRIRVLSKDRQTLIGSGSRLSREIE